MTVVISVGVCTSCQDNPPQDIQTAYTVDFEEAELGTLTLDGYNPMTYTNVLAGKAQASLCSDASNHLVGCMLFDDIIYSEQGANFGSFYSDFKELWDGTYDTTYAFVISANNELTVDTVHNQYSVYSATNGDNKFAIANDAIWFSPTYQDRHGVYDLPTIEFDKPAKPVSVKIANATYTYLQIKKNDPKVNLAVKAMGYLDGEQVSEMSFYLANNGNIVSNWKSISLEKLGTVDKICFTTDWQRTSSEVKAPEMWCPFSFCIDDLKFNFAK